MSPLGWTAFLVAAGIGAPARYVLGGWVQDRTGGVFPWGTFAVNVTGCFALGILAGLGLYHDLGSTVGTVVSSGGLGAYTTYSTFTFETLRLAEEGSVDQAARNVAASLLVGLASVSAGLALTAL